MCSKLTANLLLLGAMAADNNALAYGTLSPASAANSTALVTAQDCLNVCDDDAR